jgi:hypothetical protein
LASPNDIIDDITGYKSLLGCISYCRLTRPDIAFALHELATVAASPGPDALAAIKRTCRYLAHTKHYGIVLKSDTDTNLNVYFDASFAAGKSMRSVGGHVIFCGSTPITFQSHNIAHVVDSSAQAEAYAMHIAVKEVQFVQNILRECKLKDDNITLYTDSKALYDFTFKSGTGKRSRHWHLTLHYLKHYVGPDRQLKLCLVPGVENIADIFTKSLGHTLFHKFCSRFGLTA